MTRVRYAPRALADFDRLVDFPVQADATFSAEVIDWIIGAIEILADHPLLGRPVELGLRELPISRGKSGYIALYRFDLATDVVTILALRHQRESGFR